MNSKPKMVKKITSVNPILKEVVSYYSKLYTSANIDPNEMQCYLRGLPFSLE